MCALYLRRLAAFSLLLLLLPLMLMLLLALASLLALAPLLAADDARPRPSSRCREASHSGVPLGWSMIRPQLCMRL